MEVARMREEHPGFQAIWYGTYISSNVQTTMFMKDDLRRLGVLIFGDFDAHLAKRKEHKKLLKQRKEERKKEKADKAAEKAAATAAAREAQLDALAAAITGQQMSTVVPVHRSNWHALAAFLVSVILTVAYHHSIFTKPIHTSVFTVKVC